MSHCTSAYAATYSSHACASFHSALQFCRWKFVIHAGIDGYSRLVVFCKCSVNNQASTVLDHFMEAIIQFGLPSRIRCDRGTENYDVGYFMLSHPLRGEGRSSVIAGQSVHNQRIERWWRDLFTGCTGFFYHLFYYMEDIGVLNPDISIHLWCLHYIYHPYINSSIDEFVNAWSNHPLRSEGNKTPRQLWIQGMMSGYGLGYRAVDEVFNNEQVHYCHVNQNNLVYPQRQKSN